jgi:hypothetical protein
MNAQQKEYALSLLVKMAGYGSHKRDCLTNGPEQTSEYCDCGYENASDAYTRLFKLLKAEING